MAILWPKIGQRHFGARASHGHNLAIFHQILTNEHTKMTNSMRRIEWNKILSSISLFYILVFWPHFCSEASHGQCCTYGLKTTLKLLVHVLAIMASSYLKIVFLQKSGLNPPPPPPLIMTVNIVAGKNNGGYKYGRIAEKPPNLTRHYFTCNIIFTKIFANPPNFNCHIAKFYPILFPSSSTVSVSSTLIIVVSVLVRQFQPNYLIFRKNPPRYGRNT